MLILVLIGSALCYNHIYLPWTLSSVPYACFLVLLGTEMKHFTGIIERQKAWVLSGGFVIALIISQAWHLDMAWNSILPVVPLTIGAIAGTLMMFALSQYLSKYTTICSLVLSAVGRETFVVVAFFQIIIMAINKCLFLPSIFKYAIAIIVLVVLAYLKNVLIKIAKQN